jgi:hypothetical protein
MSRFGRQGLLKEFDWETFLKPLTWNHEQEMGGKMNAGGEDGRWNGSDGRLK